MNTNVDTKAEVVLPKPKPKMGTQRYKKVPVSKPVLSTSKQDAISGLQSLGFTKETAYMKVKELPDDMSVEDMIKRGLSK